MRSRRQALAPREQRRHALQLARNFTCSPLFLRCRSLAVYLAADGEIDPAPLVERVRRAGMRVFLPVLRPRPSRALWFTEYPPGTLLRRNRFGIPEPDIRRQRSVPPWGLDLVLMPLVAFDPQYNRLGMGGGFYDRTLASLLRRRYWHRPRLIGLAHELQRVPALTAAGWDVPLDAVITEQGFYPRQLPPQANSR